MRKVFAERANTLSRLRYGIALLVCCLVPTSAAAQNNGTLVEFDFGTLGLVDVDLFNQLTPLTVTNFLQNYVTQGRYTNTVVHSIVTPPGSPFGIIQGGEYQGVTGAPTIPQSSAVNLEYSRPNTAGTLAMFHGTDPNSATSQWFFNSVDNTAALGPGGSTTNGYAVFGWVVAGMGSIGALSALPTRDFSDGGKPDWVHFPLFNSSPVVLNSVTIVKAHLAFQNPIRATDVDGSGAVTAADLNSVLSDLTIHGIHAADGAFSGIGYWDVNGDGLVSPSDALMVIDTLAIASLPPAAGPAAGPHGMAISMGAGPMAVVPEPSCLALAVAGFLALGGYALRRRTRHALSLRAAGA